MIKLGKLTDYAVVVMTQLARNSGRVPSSAAVLSEQIAVSEPTVAKVLKILGKSGLIVSHRGVNGGYTMKRQPADITVLEIIEALEGPINMTSCVEGNNDNCVVEIGCPVRGSWDKVNETVRNALKTVTLAELSVNCSVVETAMQRLADKTGG